MTPYEANVLRAIATLGDNAYGVTIRQAVGGSIGAVYVALDRLEERGLIRTHHADPTPERGNRPKRFARVTEMREL